MIHALRGTGTTEQNAHQTQHNTGREASKGHNTMTEYTFKLDTTDNYKAPNLVPFFTKKIGATLYHGKAEKLLTVHHLGTPETQLKSTTRYFKLLVIATDEKGVWFEGWNYDTPHSGDERYSGAVYIHLEDTETVLDTLNEAAFALPLGERP